MSSSLIVKIHLTSVTIFLVFYFMKTIFLLAGKEAAFSQWARSTRRAELIVTMLFFVSGVWLFMLTGGIKDMQLTKMGLLATAIPMAILGFNRKKKIMTLTSLILLICAYGISEAARAVPYPVKHADAKGKEHKEASGKFLFENNCHYCHGVDGKKQYRHAADLSLSSKNSDQVESIIRNGRNNKMPAYGKCLSEEEIKLVTEYISALRES